MSLLMINGPPKPLPDTGGGEGGGLVPDFTADSGSTTDVQAMLDLITAAGAGKIGLIPAGTWSWTSGITWTAPDDTTIIGEGSLSTIGGGDTTVIVDNIAGDTALLDLTPGDGFRFAGLTVEGGASAGYKTNGIVLVRGTGRFDHNHLNTKTYTDTNAKIASKMLVWYGNGVIDHNIFDQAGNSALYVTNNFGASNQGNEAWADDTNFGTDEFVYVEDNQFLGDLAEWTPGQPGFASRCMDLLNAASKAVVRFNTLKFCSGPEAHQTGSAGDNRGARAKETYGNLFTTLPSQTGPAFDMHDASNGPSLVWGNTVDASALTHFILFHISRGTSQSYPGGVVVPTDVTRWGYAGPAPRRTGVVNVAANGLDVTWVSGDQFHTDWDNLANPMIFITDASCTAIPGQSAVPTPGPTCNIASVNSATSLTLASSAGGALSNKSYSVGSRWDGNTDYTGYPCLDQAGRGKGDLLTGGFEVGGGKVNDTTGTIAYPNQALEPIYVWKNTGTPSGGDFYDTDNMDGRVVSDRDYYEQASGIQTNATTPFNGTTGCGWGTIANRPPTGSLTPGVGYWAIDEGSWNTSASNPEGVNQAGVSGRLYIATDANTWTLYYTPYTYPHQLNT